MNYKPANHWTRFYTVLLICSGALFCGLGVFVIALVADIFPNWLNVLLGVSWTLLHGVSRSAVFLRDTWPT